VAKFKYLGKIVTNQSWLMKKLRGIWNQVVLATIKLRLSCHLVCCL
jgi:hypothetical protein